MPDERWAPAELPGLWVVAHYHHGHGWLQPPYARFRCPYGCHFEARGAAHVAAFVADIHHTHARRCPGPDDGSPS
ncbi:hypothetical protein OQI_33815 [Streptomyces pharetrae CZA14]|uniref:Uncharacterized protein n=1 Tax=Streptomyces pharetrae CZA14 TaxID=1144883 RepID=A0ABX3Y8U7_9ACTN|nr:hypothetical protein OQI_33815 [Streptomyces pharetrae CZA14]